MLSSLRLDQKRLAAKHPAWTLLEPTGGLFSSLSRAVAEPTATDLEIVVSHLGNLTSVFPHISLADGRDGFNEPLGGAGADADVEVAWLRAVMEGAERYAMMAHSPDDFIVATANNLGSDAIDLDLIARCSEQEYRDPACPYVPPDKASRVRWARGYSLTARQERFVPAVMSHLFMHAEPQERFWQEISTGVAAHVRLAPAILSAVCEVIERDAIALTWLARLGLPRIALRQPIPHGMAVNHRVLERSMIQQNFYDATTDIGVPIVYSVQTLEDDPDVSQHVGCAVGFDVAEICAKLIREAAPARFALRSMKDAPAAVDDFRALHHGANELGKPAYRRSFDFLLKTGRSIDIGAMHGPAAASESERLRWIVGQLHRLELEVVIVDLTTDELRDAGLWVVRAVIPGLLPMSSVQRARFLGTPRLYSYPEAAGYGRLSEADINPLPQPFA